MPYGPLKSLLIASLFFSWTAAAAAQSSVMLPGHVPSQLAAATALERVPSDERVDLTLVLKVDPALLDKTLAQLYGPGASADRHFLSSTEFADKFGLQQKRQAVAAFAQAAGLTVTPDARPGSVVLRVSGSAAQVEKAFGVQLRHYRSASGQIFRANDREPSIPASLSPHLGAVLGLSNFRGAKRPHVRHRRPSAAAGRASPRSLSAGGGYLGSLAPADIKTIYDISGTLNGSGQTIALYELDGYAQSDIAAYEVSLFPMPYPDPTVTCTSADGACGECGSGQNQPCNASTLGDGGANGDGGMTEVALDIELAIALSPNANILVYTAINNNADSLAAYADIASDNKAQVISTSWGEDEEDIGVAAMASENIIFKQMAAQGQSIYSAAGDAGAYDASGSTGDSAQEQGALLTDDPASQPYVTGVGGTNLSGTIGGSLTETVWNEGCSSTNDPGDNCAANGAGGGGVANYSGDWPLPSYQSGVSTEYSTQNRNVPDVALYADPDSDGYNICVGGTCDNCSDSDCTTIIGGTSAAAPLWASLTALVNQQRAQVGKGVLGFPNPTLYALAQSGSYGTDFNDITSGNNGFYSAGVGYDNASGLGSYKGNALIYALGTPSRVSAASPEFTNVSSAAITVNWSSKDQISGTLYTVQISSDGFAAVLASSSTYDLLATFGAGGVGPALAPATAYAFRIETTNDSITSGFSSLGQTDTLAVPPTALRLLRVWTSSMTVEWSANGNPGGTPYRVDTWQMYGTTISVVTTSTAPTLTGLAEGATYFLTVGALNGLGEISPSGLLLSTVTVTQSSATAVVPASGGTVSIHPPQGLISLQIPAGALTQPVAVTLGVPGGFPAAASAAANLTGTGFGVEISADPAVEPLTNTQLTFSYQALNTAGLDPSELSIARYDPGDNVWVPLACTVNTANLTVTGLTSHWSLFQLMTAAPAATLSEPKVFPNPFRPARGDTSITFSGLPAETTLRIYDLLGERVRELSTNDSGLASWDGRNDHGSNVASGVYFVLASSASGRKTFKVAIQR